MLWCTVTLSEVKLLVGVCYRCPSSPDVNNNYLMEVIKQAVHTANNKGLGDFNLPEIDYSLFTVDAGEECVYLVCSLTLLKT